MNILILNGSPRSNGATAKILRAMEEELKKAEDVFIDYVNLGDLEVASCIGCCSCYRFHFNGVCQVRYLYVLNRVLSLLPSGRNI